MADNHPLPWYQEGLRFQCTGCGKCCTGTPGYVWIEEEEIAEMATALHLTPSEFKKKYTRIAHGRRALIEKKREEYDCVFLENKKCLLYDKRPKQCRTYPFWKPIVQSESSWKEEAKFCEGIDHQDAPLISCEEIDKKL